MAQMESSFEMTQEQWLIEFQVSALIKLDNIESDPNIKIPKMTNEDRT